MKCSNRFVLATATAALAAALSACSSGGGGDAGTVAFIPGTAGVAFYEIMKDEGTTTAEQLDLDFIYQGAGDWAPSLQTPVVDGVCTNKPDVLIISPTDGKAMAAALQRCIDSGVKIISVDTTTDPSTEIEMAITSNNRQGGALAADFLAQTLGDGASVAVIGGQATASTNIERVEGFTNRIAEAHPGVRQLPTQWTESQDPARAQSLVNDLLVANPDLDGVFCVIENVGEGCGSAVGSSGRDVLVVSYDASDTMVELMRRGDVDAVIAQPAREEIQLAVEAAAKIIKGEAVEPEVNLENVLVTADQVDDPEAQKLFYIQD